MTVDPIPEGYEAITPYLIVSDAAAAIDFYKKALGAVEVMRMPRPDGGIGHAEIRIGTSPVMLADECPEMTARNPNHYGGSPVGLHLYVRDVDATAGNMIAAGAVAVQPVKDQFYGDRSGSFKDPFGHVWYIATHVEDVPPEELERRAAELFGSAA